MMNEEKRDSRKSNRINEEYADGIEEGRKEKKWRTYRIHIGERKIWRIGRREYRGEKWI